MRLERSRNLRNRVLLASMMGVSQGKERERSRFSAFIGVGAGAGAGAGACGAGGCFI